MMLQISPISWSHHNTWYPLMLAAVVMEIFPLMYQRVSSFVFTLAVILATAALVGMYIFTVLDCAWRSPRTSTRIRF